MDSHYTQYSDYVKTLCETKNLANFKQNPKYTYMLEHVSYSHGYGYIKEILSKTKITKDEIKEFCNKNDSIGEPNKVVYDEYLPDFSVSPTSLRYIYHSHLILTHMKAIEQITNKHQTEIIELGGGYGGLCIAIHHFAQKYEVNIKSYKICDLPNIIDFQKIYLNIVEPSLQIEFINAFTYGEHINCNSMFLISNYCFSELSKENQNHYIKNLFPKVSHGFIAWNFIPLYNFGFNMHDEPEVPNTGNDCNKYVYF